ncbi:protein-L-isoaspartate(D-aspartate) O-methyltransferase [Candidatus Berkiella aquae]|uniref:Protein-L-isoaspartate O-methyltransferase n=1 Tax=Candidatus Berkiella aquae TaxID=295108 RepID=A0A0Q9YLW7_9GAMM|nr:protein-L-isoaspartate(D-aspartate) O-methyltransferase [Candidatus Berkiella aquae]MCS5711576.1 protein-L-isoaspartate(D-aspartate) O-methyltransferase [Candidatus Berkiella aquae]
MSEQSKLIKTLKQEGITNAKVLAVLGSIPRDAFVLPNFKKVAYANQALSIECAQTISQPYIVALMTQAILKHPHPQKVLEVGTGSGYQAAVLASLFPEVWTIERIPHLYETAKVRLTTLGYDNIHYCLGDGTLGWEEAAPFDAIIVTAAIKEVPPPLINQLAPHGLIVIPLGTPHEVQMLTLIQKQGDTLRTKILAPVAFVPLIANHH